MFEVKSFCYHEKQLEVTDGSIEHAYLMIVDCALELNVSWLIA